MATIVLSAAGAALGASVGGGVLGLSSVVIGRAVGATLGRAIDQRLMGHGSEAVETGRIERFRLTGASEGAPIAQVYGRMRVSGQVIWASRFREIKRTTGGGSGKGAPKKPTVTEYSYTVSLGIALCEGEITSVGRIWANGVEVSRDDLNLRVYRGTQDQLPDPKIEAVEGTGNAPAYRGIAYLVMEEISLGDFGNRIPQFSFEVLRPAQPMAGSGDLAHFTRAVAMMPGTGEYALATTPVHYGRGAGVSEGANENSPGGKTDFVTSLDALRDELPECRSVSLVVSWFGDDLRCNLCSVAPKVEQREVDGSRMPWSVSGIDRQSAGLVPIEEDRPIYGGTPTDQSVRQAIKAINARGLDVMFYPFLLMEQVRGNELPNPWSGGIGQPVLPWRGRITTSIAAGQSSSPDGTATAEAEVAAFFGTAEPEHFDVGPSGVSYSGPPEFSYRRFILHYAHLCASAGGVDAFCVGSEMRALTQIRGAGGSFPAVAELRRLAADVRAILGASVKIGYAADWSEYFGYHPQDGSGDVLFHLDPLWADPNVDFIGIDNYMPMSDWRDGNEHADAHWGSIHSVDYLKSNIAGGEGFDWYYADPAHEVSQRRTPISDGAHGEDWIFRYKDLKGWWANRHHERIGGVRQASATAWEPAQKPIWFTEIGCAAVDKGTNQPNRFLDPKSSESGLPKYSTGRRDDLIQIQYLRALSEFWGDPENNPVSQVFGGPMVDMDRTHVWAWDARPFPWFPGNLERWSDGDNYQRGHWITGRTAHADLGRVVGEICERSGVMDYDVSRLHGLVRGYTVPDIGSARAVLQSLMLAHGFEAIERDGSMVFRSRTGQEDDAVERSDLAVSDEAVGDILLTRAPAAEIAGRLLLSHVGAEADYETRTAEAVFPDEASRTVSQSELPMVLTGAEARGIVERWLAEARVARDTVRFSLPPSRLAVGAGDVVRVSAGDGAGLYRIDLVERTELQTVEAIRVEPDIYVPSDAVEEVVRMRPFTAPVPVLPLFLDLPLLTGDEIPHAPHVAVTARPWPGSAAAYSSAEDAGYQFNLLLQEQSLIGVSKTALLRAAPGLLDRGDAIRVELTNGELASVSLSVMLNGANAAAIGSGSGADWEVFQFADARIVGPRTFELSTRLRGQAGTDATMPDIWPAGSYVVLLDGAPRQIELAQSARGLARHYRIGPAQRGYDDPSYTHFVGAFDGIGLRPYAPVHLRVSERQDGGRDLSWIRRTRIDGDSWQSAEVPLGEDTERYLVRVINGDSVVRSTETSTSNWSYSGVHMAADGIVAPYAIEVAQLSGRFGPGPFTRIVIND